MESINALCLAEIPEFTLGKGFTGAYESKSYEDLVKVPPINKTDEKSRTVALREGSTTEELTKFTEGVKKYHKDFWAIKKKFLPQRDVTEIVEFYYGWKRSDKVKGQQQSRGKMVRYMAARISSADVGFDSVGATGKFTRSKQRALELDNGSA